MPVYSDNPQLMQDFLGYFSSATPGDTRDWASGTLEMQSNRSAKYTDPMGQSFIFGQNFDPSTVAGMSPYIKNLWDTTYYGGLDLEEDVTPSTSQSGTLGATPDLIGGWLDQLDKMIDPQAFEQRATDIYGKARGDVSRQYADQRNLVPYMMRNNLMPQLQSGINSLASRNMINSSVGGDVLSQISRSAQQDALGSIYDIGTAESKAISDLIGEEAALKASLPVLTAGAAQNLGGFSESDSGNWQLLASLFPSLMEYGG